MLGRRRRRGGRGARRESGLLTLFVIAGNTLLRPLVNSINRIPIDEETSEATYEVRLSANPERRTRRAKRSLRLEKAHYPVSDVDSNERGDDAVEIVATLIATAIVPEELDAVVEALESFLALSTRRGRAPPRVEAASGSRRRPSVSSIRRGFGRRDKGRAAQAQLYVF